MEERKQKTLKQYADELSKANPGELASLLWEMTADYAEVCDMLLPLERAKMDFWITNKKLESDKPVSDKTLDMMWLAEKGDLNGYIQKRAEIYKKCLEKLMSNLKAILRQKENEARNQY